MTEPLCKVHPSYVPFMPLKEGAVYECPECALDRMLKTSAAGYCWIHQTTPVFVKHNGLDEYTYCPVCQGDE